MNYMFVGLSILFYTPDNNIVVACLAAFSGDLCVELIVIYRISFVICVHQRAPCGYFSGVCTIPF